MTNLRNLFRIKLTNKILLRLMLVMALVGIADTTYLTTDYFFGTGIKCLLLEGCEVVLTSPYSKMFRIPLAFFGLGFYMLIFVLVSAADIYESKLVHKAILLAGTIGFLFSLYFLYLQVFVIQALCIYCLTSLFSSTVIFGAGVVLYRRGRAL